MRSPCSRLLADPILHFTVLGAALFGLHALVAGPETMPAEAAAAKPSIVVPAARVAGLAESWTQAWGRAPSGAEMEELIEEEVRTEVLAREAIALGLDRDDEFIRQHLRERLEVLIDAGGSTAQPTEAELEAFYAANRSRFGAGPVLTFDQVTLDPAKRADTLAADAAALLQRLRRGEALADLAALSDSLELPVSFEAVPEGEVEALFGAGFAQALDDGPTGAWSGPIPSDYGQHLVRLASRTEATGLPFVEVRDEVREEWLAARVAARRDRQYRDLRSRYTIAVARPPAADIAAASPP